MFFLIFPLSSSQRSKFSGFPVFPLQNSYLQLTADIYQGPKRGQGGIFNLETSQFTDSHLLFCSYNIFFFYYYICMTCLYIDHPVASFFIFFFFLKFWNPAVNLSKSSFLMLRSLDGFSLAYKQRLESMGPEDIWDLCPLSGFLHGREMAYRNFNHISAHHTAKRKTFFPSQITVRNFNKIGSIWTDPFGLDLGFRLFGLNSGYCMFYWGEGDKTTMIGSYQLGFTWIWGWRQFHLKEMDGMKWNECQGVNKMLNTIGSAVFQRSVHYAGTYHGYATHVTAHSYQSLHRANSTCTLYRIVVVLFNL